MQLLHYNEFCGDGKYLSNFGLTSSLLRSSLVSFVGPISRMFDLSFTCNPACDDDSLERN